VREVFHARFDEHAYPRHTHDVWTVLIVDRGDIRFALDGRDHGSVRSSVTVLPPHVAHDGRAGRSGSFVKRVLYLDGIYLDDGLVGRAVDRPTFVDGPLRSALASAHLALDPSGDPLAAESYLALAGERLHERLRRHPEVLDEPPAGRLADLTRELLDAHVRTGLTLQDLGARLGASRGHLVRSFTTRFGVPPHAYLLGRRIELARSLLLEGRPVAEVAIEVGFHDQPHLHRHFVRHVGTPPGRYATSAQRG
jgi:AraC-like DNA-binding protein